MIDFKIENPLNLKYSITGAIPEASSDMKGFDKIKFIIEVESLDNNNDFKKTVHCQ